MKYSFITPVYNTKPSLLKRCIDSIERFGLEEYELVWVNDGSDNIETNDYCVSLCESNDHFKYYYQENQGSAVARNKALDMATGDIVVFVDSDDVIDENFSIDEKLYVENDIVFYRYKGVGWNAVDETIVVNELLFGDISDKKDEIQANILYNNSNEFNGYACGSIWAKTFSRKFIERNHLRFDDELRKTQDRIFMLDAIATANKIFFSSSIMYDYMSNPESVVHKLNFNIIDYCKAVLLAADSRAKKYHIDFKRSKYFRYNIFLEVILLTYCHKECGLSRRDARSGFNELYKLYDLDAYLKKLKTSDFSTLKAKAKFLAVKYHMYGLLNYWFTR